jgi:hypothetical protein
MDLTYHNSFDFDLRGWWILLEGEKTLGTAGEIIRIGSEVIEP